MATKIYAAQTVGLNAHIIDVEVDLSRGLHSFSIVGLPDKAIDESKDRISAAIKNSGFISPQRRNQRIIVSLAPADLKKEGPVFDLAIALGYLQASKQIALAPEKRIFLGELALDGSIRGVKGVLLIARHAKKIGIRELYLPRINASEAALVGDLSIYACDTINDLVRHFGNKKNEGDPATRLSAEPRTIIKAGATNHTTVDISDIRGQEMAKRGLEIAAAGGHNIAMSGPPGTGKTMLAKAFAGILPPLTLEESLEVTAIHSVSGHLRGSVITERPFRSPHHTASYAALIGGGAYPKPGEITLAHRGVLFADEFPEFDRRVVESLRGPLEDGAITISRAKDTISFPARFILVATMNPCPCGNTGSRTRECICSQGALLRYRRKISGPIIDRIDLWIDVPQVDHKKLSGFPIGEHSHIVRARVAKARDVQRRRFRGRSTATNSEMNVRELGQFAVLSKDVNGVLQNSASKLDLSPRSYHRVIKLARTIADLGGEDNIKKPHILEALQYRPKASN